MEGKIDNIAKRFLEQLEIKKISGYKMVTDGVIKSQSSLTGIKTGRHTASPRIIEKCADLYGLDKAYIFLGNETNSTSSEDSASVSPVKTYIKEELINIPLVQQDAAASFIEGYGDLQNCKADHYGVMQEEGEDLTNGKYVVFQVKGDSMTPNIPDSAKVLARKVSEAKWEEVGGVVFVAYGKTLTIKRVLKNMLYINNTLTLKADNPIYGQIDVGREEIRGIWTAERIVSQKIR